MDARYADLFTRINNHCREQNWYGPDLYAPARYRKRYVYGVSIATARTFIEDRWSDTRIVRHPYPPATEEQLRVTEERLGAPLPPVLRALYATVGNGGFGPAYGLTGVTGGFPSVYVWPDSIEEYEEDERFVQTLYFTDDFHSSPARDSVIDSVEDLPLDQLQAYRAPAPKKRRKHPKKDRTLVATLSRTDWHLSERVTQALKQEPGRYLECETVPDGLVTLCHWGCGIFSHLDLQTGHIYILFAVRQHGFVGESWDVAPEDRAIGVEYQANSAEDWLDQWLRGELGQGQPQKVMLLSEIMDA